MSGGASSAAAAEAAAGSWSPGPVDGLATDRSAGSGPEGDSAGLGGGWSVGVDAVAAAAAALFGGGRDSPPRRGTPPQGNRGHRRPVQDTRVFPSSVAAAPLGHNLDAGSGCQLPGPPALGPLSPPDPEVDQRLVAAGSEGTQRQIRRNGQWREPSPRHSSPPGSSESTGTPNLDFKPQETSTPNSHAEDLARDRCGTVRGREYGPELLAVAGLQTGMETEWLGTVGRLGGGWGRLEQLAGQGSPAAMYRQQSRRVLMPPPPPPPSPSPSPLSVSAELVAAGGERVSLGPCMSMRRQ